jgi:mono/diheme cytochrome c family protein
MRSLIVVLAVAVPLLTGCSGGGAPAEDLSAEDLRDAVAATFESRCIGCHGTEAPSSGLSLTEDRMEDSLINSWSYVNEGFVLVKPGEPEESFLIKILRGDHEAGGLHMPPNGIMGDAEIDLIYRWVESLGADES